jgi:hypothetical protein
MMKIDALKGVEANEQKKLSAIEQELKTQKEILNKVTERKESEKNALEFEAKNAAESEVKRMEAAKRLKSIEDNINFGKIQQ